MDTQMKQTKEEKENVLSDVIQIFFLNRENAAFSIRNNFLTMSAQLPDETGEIKERHFERVFVHRAFPFDEPQSYISVQDGDRKELGMIRELHDLSEQSAEAVTEELERKYYAPVIQRIESINERYGFSYWKILTDAGEMNLTLQDTYRSLLRVTSDRVFIVDIDGNRYEIPSLEKLDSASYKRIELYL